MFGQPKIAIPWRVRYGTSREIMRQSFRFVRRERDLWIFPILSTVLMAVLIGLVFAAFAMFDVVGFMIATMGSGTAWLASVVWFVLFLPVLYPFMLVSSVLNTSYVYALYERMEGRPVDRRVAWARGWGRLGTLARFNLIGMLVALVLQFVGALLEKLRVFPFLGNIVHVLGGFAWAIAAFFVFPVIAVERERSAVAALKTSAHIARSQWGKSVAGLITIGLVLVIPLLVLMLALMILVFGALMWDVFGASALSFTTVLVLAGVIFGVTVLASVALQSALQPAYQVALYRYARTGRITEPYDRATLVDAWAPYVPR